MNARNLYLAMFSPSTIQIVPFDPEHGPDTARQYAGKYASKPEKWCLRVHARARRSLLRSQFVCPSVNRGYSYWHLRMYLV